MHSKRSAAILELFIITVLKGHLLLPTRQLLREHFVKERFHF